MSGNYLISEDVIQEQILKAAKQLFQVHGLRKVTMDDVAKAIGKGRSSLYYYYKSKEEILDAVMDIEIKEMIARITGKIEKAVTAEQKIYAFCVTKLEILRERRSVYNTMEAGMDAQEISSYNKIKENIHRRIMQQEGSLLNQVFSDGIASGELQPMTREEQNTVVLILLSCLRGLKREMVIEDDFTGVESTTAILTRMTIYGLKK